MEQGCIEVMSNSGKSRDVAILKRCNKQGLHRLDLHGIFFGAAVGLAAATVGLIEALIFFGFGAAAAAQRRWRRWWWWQWAAARATSATGGMEGTEGTGGTDDR